MGVGQQTFVPAPAGRAAPVAAGAAAMLGAAPAFADKIDDAAKKLSEASYPFIKEIDWTSDVYAKLPTQGPLEVLKAIDKMLVMGAAMGHMVASAGTAKTMDVYNAFAKFNLGKDVGPYMMSKVTQSDAEAAYKAFLEFKDVVKVSR